MKYIKRFNKWEIINELYVHTSDKEDLDGKYFILYKKDLWIFDDNEWEDNEIWEEVNDSTDSLLFNSDLYSSLQEVSSEHAYILTGQIEGGYILLNGGENFRHSKSSPDLIKLKKEINLPIKVNYRKGIYLDGDGEHIVNELGELKDVHFYHGTSTKYLKEISKKGIRPMAQNTNFKKIKHRDKIFFTSNIEKALFHANTTALNTQSFPIILKFKVPDTSKLVIDYDVSIDFYGVENDQNDHLGYSDIHRGTGGYSRGKSIIDDSEDINISNKLGIFGYKGRIPPSHIEVLFDSIILSRNVYLLDDELKEYYYTEELTYESDIWDHFSDVDQWSEMDIKDVVKYIDNLIEDELDEYRNEEDGEY